MAESKELYTNAILSSVPPVAAADIVRDRLNRAKALNEEIADWARERARIENNYAAELEKLSRRATPSSGLLGALAPTWTLVVASVEQSASTAKVLSHKLHAEIETPLRGYASRSTQFQEVRQLQEALAQLARQLSHAEEKMRHQRPSEEHQIQLAESRSSWESQAPYLTEQLEVADEARLVLVKDSLTRMQTLEVDRAQGAIKEAEKSLNSILSFEPYEDMNGFASKAASGALSPRPEAPRTSSFGFPHPHHEQSQNKRHSAVPQRGPFTDAEDTSSVHSKDKPLSAGRAKLRSKVGSIFKGRKKGKAKDSSSRSEAIQEEDDSESLSSLPSRRSQNQSQYAAPTQGKRAATMPNEVPAAPPHRSATQPITPVTGGDSVRTGSFSTYSSQRGSMEFNNAPQQQPQQASGGVPPPPPHRQSSIGSKPQPPPSRKANVQQPSQPQPQPQQPQLSQQPLQPQPVGNDENDDRSPFRVEIKDQSVEKDESDDIVLSQLASQLRSQATVSNRAQRGRRDIQSRLFTGIEPSPEEQTSPTSGTFMSQLQAFPHTTAGSAALTKSAEQSPTSPQFPNANQFPQSNANQAPQANANQAPQANANQFPQSNANQFPQSNANQFPQSNANQFPQPNVNPQPSTNQFPQSNVDQFPQHSANEFQPAAQQAPAQTEQPRTLAQQFIKGQSIFDETPPISTTNIPPPPPPFNVRESITSNGPARAFDSAGEEQSAVPPPPPQKVPLSEESSSSSGTGSQLNLSKELPSRPAEENESEIFSDARQSPELSATNPVEQQAITPNSAAGVAVGAGIAAAATALTLENTAGDDNAAPTQSPEEPEQPTTEKPAEPVEPNVEQPTVEAPSEEPAVEEPIAEPRAPVGQPIVEEPAEQKSVEPIVEQPGEQKSVEPVVEQPTEQKSVVPAVEQPTELPAVEQRSVEPAVESASNVESDAESAKREIHPIDTQFTGRSSLSGAPSSPSPSSRHPDLPHGASGGLAATVVEGITANLKDGVVESASAIGEVAFGFVGSDPPNEINIRVADSSRALDKVIPNPGFMAPSAENEFRVTKTGLIHNLRVGVVGLKYTSSKVTVPIVFTPVWRLEENQASLMLVYKLAEEFEQSQLIVSDLVISVPVEGGHAVSAQSRPTASFNRESQRITWRFPSPVTLSKGVEEKLLCRFSTSSRVREAVGGINVKFTLQNLPLTSWHLEYSTVTCDPFSDDQSEIASDWAVVVAKKTAAAARYTAHSDKCVTNM